MGPDNDGEDDEASE